MIKSGINYPHIKSFTIDPNGYCNAKCWYCINGYQESKSSIMSLENVEIIIDKILNEKGNIVDEDLDTMYFHHFNEILLYPHFDGLLDLLKKKKLKTHIFSNGTNLTPNKYHKILEYPDVVKSVVLNVPSINQEDWKLRVGLDDNQYNKLINNLNYINDNKKDLRVSIEVNGLNKQSLFENGAYLAKLKKFPSEIKDDLDDQYDDIKEKYVNLNVVKNYGIVDWGIFLEDREIYSMTMGILLNKKKDNNKIVDCECNNRIYNYLDINSNGDVFLCLKDTGFRTKYGNILEQDLVHIWNSDLRKKVIEYETTEGICTQCRAAIWKK